MQPKISEADFFSFCTAMTQAMQVILQLVNDIRNDQLQTQVAAVSPGFKGVVSHQYLEEAKTAFAHVDRVREIFSAMAAGNEPPVLDFVPPDTEDKGPIIIPYKRPRGAAPVVARAAKPVIEDAEFEAHDVTFGDTEVRPASPRKKTTNDAEILEAIKSGMLGADTFAGAGPIPYSS